MLTKKQKGRMMEDLVLISKLKKIISKNDQVLIVDGGYGVDATCNQNITRFHHDIDLIILSTHEDKNLMRETLSEILNKECFKENETVPRWLWYTKNDHDFNNKPRQINLQIIMIMEFCLHKGYAKVISQNKIEYVINIQKSKIYDTNNTGYEFLTLTPEEYAAAKIRLIPAYAPDWKIRDSDVHDFKLLFSNKNFVIEKFFFILKSYYTALSSVQTFKKILCLFILNYKNTLSKKQILTVKQLLGSILN